MEGDGDDHYSEDDDQQLRQGQEEIRGLRVLLGHAAAVRDAQAARSRRSTAIRATDRDSESTANTSCTVTSLVDA